MIFRTKQRFVLKKAVNDLKYHNNSIIIKNNKKLNYLLTAGAPLKMSRKLTNWDAIRFICTLFFLVFIRVFKTAACYKVTYRWLNLHITELSTKT
jgi:hypothetical protein